MPCAESVALIVKLFEDTQDVSIHKKSFITDNSDNN